jgi:hypothetical protein
MPMELVTQLPYDHPYRWDGTRFGGPKLWRPTDMATALWLDAEDTSTITLNGSTVSQWADKSGNGRNAVQAVAAAQPTYNATGLNNKPSLSFDGSNDILRTATPLGISGAAPRTFAYVGQSVSGIGTPIQIGTETVLRAFGRAFGSPGLLYHWVVDLTVSTPAINSPFQELLQSTGAVSAGYRNGSLVNSGSFALNTFDSVLYLGGRTAPDFPSATSYANFLCSEVLVINSALSTADRQRIEGYLAWKWGLQANLPADHPYKTLPPTV